MEPIDANHSDDSDDRKLDNDMSDDTCEESVGTRTEKRLFGETNSLMVDQRKKKKQGLSNLIPSVLDADAKIQIMTGNPVITVPKADLQVDRNSMHRFDDSVE